LKINFDEMATLSGGATRKSKFALSGTVCRILAGCTVAVFLISLLFGFDYHRVATYELRWTTGDVAGFDSYGPNVDKNGNRKILVLLPGDQPRCYMISYSNDLLTYLSKQNRATIPLVLRLNYSFGKIYSFEVVRITGYGDGANTFTQSAHSGGGNCMEHLAR